MQEKIKIGDKFTSILKRGDRSKDLKGRDRTGRVVGTFTCTDFNKVYVYANDRAFQKADFEMTRVR